MFFCVLRCAVFLVNEINFFFEIIRERILKTRSTHCQLLADLKPQLTDNLLQITAYIYLK